MCLSVRVRAARAVCSSPNNTGKNYSSTAAAFPGSLPGHVELVHAAPVYATPVHAAPVLTVNNSATAPNEWGDWVRVWDKNVQRYYYFQESGGDPTWTQPAGWLEAEETSALHGSDSTNEDGKSRISPVASHGPAGRRGGEQRFQPRLRVNRCVLHVSVCQPRPAPPVSHALSRLSRNAATLS